MSADRERLAALLTEVKLAERKVEKLEQQLGPREEAIKSALRAGERERAKELALSYEELKDELGRAEQQVVRAKQAHALAKKQGQELGRALERKELTDALGAVADTLLSVNKDDDILARLERENALQQARAEIALSDAGVEVEDEPPRASPEDILKEFE
ncbi:MAG TPA: hypothetical protein DEA08_37940 [Planctomycetes bacterium]|nr:hypothetical protein [Planctomycetota bacterium]